MMKPSDFLPARGLDSLSNLFGVVHRRFWSSPGKLHLELPDMELEEFQDLAEVLKRELEALEGVYWAAANGATERMVVAWNETQLSEEEILAVADEVDRRFHFGEDRFHEGESDHPGDDEPILRGMVRMGADVVGASMGMAMKVFRRKPGRRRVDMASLMTIVDNVPHIREAIEARLGTTPTDMSIGVGNPLIQGMGSGVVGPVLDFFFQAGRYVESVHRKAAWEKREPELCDRPERAASPRWPKPERPTEMPDGPIEEYAEDVWNMSLGGFFVGLADTQELDQAITALLDALPKPARYGRDSFGARLTSVLTRRNMVVMHPGALRRLDRIDCVIVDDSMLMTDRWRLGRLVGDPDEDRVTLYDRASQLLDPLEPDKVQEDEEGWSLQPASQVDPPEAWVAELREGGARGDLLALCEGGEVRALMSLRSVVDPGSQMIVESIRQADLELIIASDRPEEMEQFQPDRIKTHEGLYRFIRHIQRDYQVVGFVGCRDRRAMVEADCSLGVVKEGKEIPWSADILAEDEVTDIAVWIDAMVKARQVSKICAMLAGAGAGIGALTAVRGLENTAPDRVMTTVNLVSVIALMYGAFRGERVGRRVKPPPPKPTPWHRMRLSDVFETLDSSVQGLRSSDVEAREMVHREMPSARRRLMQAMGKELANPLTPVLVGGAVVSSMVGSITDAAIVGAVIAFNGIVGGAERFKAESAIAEMARRETVKVQAKRDGQWDWVDEDQLVVGDVVELEAGQVVPADCRVLEARHLEVDESSLTGESVPVIKHSGPSFADRPAERHSMLYDGTAVVAGKCRAVVVAIGSDTEVQRSRWLGRKQTDKAEGVEGRLEYFSEMTLPFAGVSGALLMSLGILRRHPLKELVGPAVNLAVGAVPEGLPLLSTAAQLAAARRLSERQVIVHNPRAMEALGRCDMLCLDKTGTLTEGTLELAGVCDMDRFLEASDTGWSSTHKAVLENAYRATPIGDREDVPHATDRAVIEGGRELGIDGGRWSPKAEVPFKTELSFHATLGEGERFDLAVKGSPEAVIARSGSRAGADGPMALDEEGRATLLARAEELAAKGYRVLAVGARPYDGKMDNLNPEEVQDLEFLGFVTFTDTLRRTAIDAVEAIKRAGVSMMMLTGDHPETARRIAKKVGIAHQNEVLTGDQIDALDDDELEEVLPSTTVIARMTPAHKVRIVEALQRAGMAVAMTGDGGNDAAAIRLADAGIALGADAATAAQDAADLVVADGRIETLVDAIVEGRAMWRSVRDAVSILIGGNMGEVGFMVLSGLVKTIPALNARQLLLVNLFTDVAPSMAIALRPPPDITPDQLLHEGPEESLGEALERDILMRAGVTATSSFMAWNIARYTFQGRRASTVGLLTVVLSQLGQTLTTAKPTLPVWIAGVGSAGALLVLIETPVISHLLGCRPLGPVGLTTAFGTSAAATAASMVLPRLPEWKRAVEARFPEIREPRPSDFVGEFYEAHASGWGEGPRMVFRPDS